LDGFLEILTRKWKAVSTKHRKGTSTDDSGSNGALVMRTTSTVDPEIQCGQEWCDEEKQM